MSKVVKIEKVNVSKKRFKFKTLLSLLSRLFNMTERVMWEQQDPAFDMEEIDRIDEENRRKDLFQLLDGINSFSALPIHFTEGGKNCMHT